MSFVWGDHQFVAGAVSLDFVNTVIYRGDPARRYDRLQTLEACRRWAAAARRYGALSTGGEVTRLTRLKVLREAIDGLFRPIADGCPADSGALRNHAGQVLGTLAGCDLRLGPDGLEPAPNHAGAAPLAALLAHSALVLACSPRAQRVKACPSCAWLFVDMSNGLRRRWCDMRSCGNRAKARRFHARQRMRTPPAASGRMET